MIIPIISIISALSVPKMGTEPVLSVTALGPQNSGYHCSVDACFVDADNTVVQISITQVTSST